MLIKCVEYLKKEGKIKIVVQTKRPVYDVSLLYSGKSRVSHSNDFEPYDRKTHVFYVGEKEVQENDKLTLKYKLFKKLPICFKEVFEFVPIFANEERLIFEYDHKLRIQNKQEEILDEGVTYTHYICTDKENLPVNLFTLTVDCNKASLYVGTPNDGYESRNVKATIPEMIDSAVKNGVHVVAAANADFFEIMGDHHPSGLCVKNGKLIANPDSLRPFLGIKKDGSPVITDITESPNIIKELRHAVAGREMIVKDGKIFDFSPLEPFSYIRHPRTAAGVTKDNKVILLVADGRIPEYSNGATLVDLGNFLISLGADRVINLDGGGSSVIYTKKDDEFVLRTVPADLFRPRAKLIRKEFNCLLVVKK